MRNKFAETVGGGCFPFLPASICSRLRLTQIRVFKNSTPAGLISKGEKKGHKRLNGTENARVNEARLILVFEK